MAAQHGLQVLAGAEPAPQPAAVAEDHGEQPHRADVPGLVVEDGLEVGEVDLGLLAGRRLEAAFEAGLRRRAHLAEEVGHGGVAARVAEIGDLAHQAAAGQPRVVGEPVAQIVLVEIEQPRPRLPGSVARGLQPLVEILAHGLAVETGSAGDGGYAQALTLQIVDHDNLPQNNHSDLP